MNLDHMNLSPDDGNTPLPEQNETASVNSAPAAETVPAAELASVTEVAPVSETIISEDVPVASPDGEAVEEFVESYSFEPRFDEKKEKRTFSLLGWGMACFTFVSMLVSTILVVIVSAVAPEVYNTPLFMHAVTPVSMYLVALPILMIFLSKLPASAPEKKEFGFGKWMLFLLVGFGLMYMGSQVTNIIMNILIPILGYDPTNTLDSMVANSNVWVNLLFLVVVAPIGEEFVFRKLIIDRTRKYGCFVSALFSGLVFGLMHGNLYQCFYAFAIGLLLGYLYYTTGKLHLTIAIHAVVNFISGVLAGLLYDGMDSMLETVETMDWADMSVVLEFLGTYGLVLLGLAIFTVFQWGTIACAITLPIVNRRRIVLEKGEVQIPRGRGFSTLFLSVGGIVMLVLYGLEIILSLLP